MFEERIWPPSKHTPYVGHWYEIVDHLLSFLATLLTWQYSSVMKSEKSKTEVSVQVWKHGIGKDWQWQIWLLKHQVPIYLIGVKDLTAAPELNSSHSSLSISISN
ncbi:hypothetical protein NE237_017517 [Protea cynaroides]|uniref:Uncharacterized protein n=1 Tax=Protea cynaroides TaxID=273540 RepID=A0A9Q0QN38_9MAGN|nr:hypothetical protein NE237_017517 [Protea cynaroides]